MAYTWLHNNEQRLQIENFCVFSGLFCFSAGHAQAWQLEHVEQDIKIYLQNNSSSIKTFKGEAIINAPVDSILNVFSDVKACPVWFHHCKDPLVINYVSDAERFHLGLKPRGFPLMILKLSEIL